MLVMITGGSGSGKSAYAERVLSALAEREEKSCRSYYLATMMVYGEEGRRKVERHRKLREGKGFVTVEQPLDIADCPLEAGENAALLECMSNLAANEMFREETPKMSGEVAEKIIAEIDVLREQLSYLVIVTNNVFEDGISYEEETMNYIRALGEINRKLAERADVVTEVVAGIPVAVKGEIIL